GLIEQLVEVRGDDVAGAGKDAHPGYSGSKGTDRRLYRGRGRGGSRAGAQPLDLAVDPRGPRTALVGAERIVVVTAHASSTTDAAATTVCGAMPSWWVSASTLKVTIAAMLTSAARPSLLVKNSRSYMAVIPLSKPSTHMSQQGACQTWKVREKSALERGSHPGDMARIASIWGISLYIGRGAGNPPIHRPVGRVP